MSEIINTIYNVNRLLVDVKFFKLECRILLHINIYDLRTMNYEL